MDDADQRATDVVDLGDYVGLLRRRAWLIVLVTLLTIGMAAVYTFTLTPTYTALTEVLVQPPATSTQYRPDQLVSLDTEASVVTSGPVAEIALRELGWPMTVPALLEQVHVKTTPENLVLDISFDDNDPARAAMGAQAFATAYLEYQQERTRLSNEALIAQAQEQLADAQQEQSDIEAKLEDAKPGSNQARELEQDLTQVDDTIARLREQINTYPTISDPGTIILEATTPKSPSSPKHSLDLALGLFLGLFLGVIAAFVRDRTDERISGRHDMERVLHVPLLAVIPHEGNRRKHEPAMLVTEQQSRSPAAEAYRTLRTSVMAAARQSGATVLAITSPGVGDGKTTTVANLAAALSHAGNRVLAISADLRRPSLHRAFQLENRRGLSDVLLGTAKTKESLQEVSPNLQVLTSGRVPLQPAELLQSPKMRRLLDKQKERFDFVLVDCPPTLGLADTLAISPFVDGVILVARSEITKRGPLIQSAQQLGQVGAIVRGSILNDLSLSKRSVAEEYGYGYDPRQPGGDATSGRSASSPAGKQPRRRWLRRSRASASDFAAKRKAKGKDTSTVTVATASVPGIGPIP
jgi:capsular exopolysaccharide synthesis family protein